MGVWIPPLNTPPPVVKPGDSYRLMVSQRTPPGVPILEPRPEGAVKKTYCRVGARERQAHAKLSAPKRRPCRNRNFCASTPD